MGGGALLLAKIFGSDLLGVFAKPKAEKELENFRVVEDDKELVVYDKSGEAIFIIDKNE